jgi:hypothetical protein
LVLDPEAKHVQRLGTAVWLFLYLILHAKRGTGFVIHPRRTIARRMHVPLRTVQRWLACLQRHGYVEVLRERPVLYLQINRWKPITTGARNGADHARAGARRAKNGAR